MTTVKRLMTGFRLAAVLALLVSSLAVAIGATAGAASASTGHTIATAGTLSIGDSANGGGGPIDFWKVHLNGGDRISLLVTPSTTNYNFTFQLFAPGTTDGNFSQARSFSGGSTNGAATTVIDLQAPYNGTFILAACENTTDCVGVDSGSGNNQMDPYAFSSSFVTSISATVAAREVRGNPAITGARLLDIGHFQSGGGNRIDYWRVHLAGGDRVRLAVTTSTTNYNFTFQLFAPGTTDGNFSQARSFSGGSTNGAATTVIDLQAPYNGTFILAACENTTDCVGVDSGSGNNPMDPYTFTPTLIGGGVPPSVAAKEVKASPTIARAAWLRLGNFEAGGGNGIDFWKVRLARSDRVRLAVTPSTANYSTTVQLFPPGTTDANFPSRTAVAGGSTNGAATTVINMRAPRGGTFILAACENTSDCVGVDSGSGNNPMDPYTFTIKRVGGKESRTYLSLSTHVIRYHHERALRFHVHVVSVYGRAKPTGHVYVRDGKQTVCGVKLSHGRGTCRPSSNTKIRPGKYWITAHYHGGNRYGSVSGRTRLTVNTGKESRTFLSLSTHVIRYHHERSLKFSVRVVSVYGRAKPTGHVYVRDGKQTVCGVKLSHGRGTCRPSSNTKIRPGKYWITAHYHGGNRLASTSRRTSLTVKR